MCINVISGKSSKGNKKMMDENVFTTKKKREKSALFDTSQMHTVMTVF